MTTATIEPKSFEYISELILNKSAIVLEKSKAYLIESRLSPVARECGLDTVEDLIAQLQSPGSQGMVQKVVDAMTTNETSFFRDLHPFQAMKTTADSISLPSPQGGAVSSQDLKPLLRAKDEAALRERSRFLLALKYIEMEELSSGQAAALCGMERVAFLLEAARCGVPAFDLSAEEIEREFADA